MTSPIVIRAYAVGFGDCILARIPDGKTVRHVLVDFGRAPGKGGTTAVFASVAKDIQQFCGGHLDLLVATHEHLDHIEGFHQQRKIFDALDVDHVWMGLPSAPSYYREYPEARPQKRLRELAAAMLERSPRRGFALDAPLRSLLENNVSNAERVDYLRNLRGGGGKRKAKVHYLARNRNATDVSPFARAQVRILAPEADVSEYYAGRRVHSLAAAAAVLSGSPLDGDERWAFAGVDTVPAPENLLPSDWIDLRERIRGGGVAVARFIDRAQNNTSLCFLLEIGGKRLLFPGDAEIESWETMARNCRKQMRPVDFLKVSHHGSCNGTPVGVRFPGGDGSTTVLDRLLPRDRKSKAVALVSTKRLVYGTEHPVPDARVLDELGARCRAVHDTDVPDRLYLEFEV